MSDSLSKKFISDEEMIDIAGPSWITLPMVRACIDKALEKAGVTTDSFPACQYSIGKCESGHRQGILYIQPAPKVVRSAEERIKAALDAADCGAGVESLRRILRGDS